MAKLNIGGTIMALTLLINLEEVEFKLRKPSLDEMQDFFSSKVVVTGQKVHDRSLIAQCDFFDLLITEIRDLVDEEGVPITAERKDVIPVGIKDAIITHLFERRNFVILEKN